MEDTFTDRVGAVFDGAESIDFRQGESAEGEYKFARISGVHPDTAEEQVRELQGDDIDATTVEAADGFQVEAWTV